MSPLAIAGAERAFLRATSQNVDAHVSSHSAEFISARIAAGYWILPCAEISVHLDRRHLWNLGFVRGTGRIKAIGWPAFISTRS